MALKDLKSDLSKFRKPTSTPLDKKETVQPESFNTTPLSDKVQGKKVLAPKVTPEKVGVDVKILPSGNIDKLAGLPDPKPMSLAERFLGETKTTEVQQGDKFKGETTTTEVQQGDKFKGETTTTEVQQGDKFKGETKTTEVQQGDKFKGETTPTEATQGDIFKGETTPTEATQGDIFKGETTPATFKFTQNFLGETTPKESTLTEQFLGETTPNLSDISSKFLGETTPNEADNTSNFLGETTPNESDISSNFLGETTPNLSDRSSNFLGETDQIPSDISSKFLGETDTQVLNQGDKFKGNITTDPFGFSPKLEGEGKSFETVNYITDEKAVGFSPFMKTIDDTKFTGIEGTEFNSSNSLLSNFDNAFPGLAFTPGYGQYKVGSEIAGSPRYSPNSGKYYDAGTFLYPNFSLETISQQKNSPSFLDNMYNKFNLQDDASNRLSIFKQPYVLRGIQRKNKTEPQNWDLTGLGIDDGFIRGGTVTSLNRAAIDLVRLGSFFLSVKGLLWSVRQFGTQKANAFGRTWTPINLLAGVGGGLIGLRPDRSGVILQDKEGKYKKLGLSGYKDKISDFYEQLVKAGPMIAPGMPFPSTLLNNGGFDSVYGLGISLTSRGTSTLGYHNAGQDFGNRNGAQTGVRFFQRFNPMALLGQGSGTYTENLKKFDNGELAEDSDKIIELSKGVLQKDRDGRTTSPYITDGKKNIDILAQKYNPYASDAKTYNDDVPADKTDKLKFGNTQQVLGDIDDTHKKKYPGENLLSSEGNTAGALNDIKDFNGMSYKNLQNKAKLSTGQPPIIPKDFRDVGTSQQQGFATESDFTSKNLETNYKFGTPGKMFKTDGKVRDKWTITYSDAGDYKGYYDEVQASTIGTTGTDIIPLVFKTTGAGDNIQFRGTISGLSENFSPGYTDIKYTGRAEPVYVYDTFKRDISFNFKVYPTSRIEMEPLWTKLERLSTYTMPQYASVGYTAPGATDLKLTIGQLYNQTPMILTTLSYTYSDDTPWDIDYQLPMGIDISVGCTVLGNGLHKYKADNIFGTFTRTQ